MLSLSEYGTLIYSFFSLSHEETINSTTTIKIQDLVFYHTILIAYMLMCIASVIISIKNFSDRQKLLSAMGLIFTDNNLKNEKEESTSGSSDGDTENEFGKLMLTVLPTEQLKELLVDSFADLAAMNDNTPAHEVDGITSLIKDIDSEVDRRSAILESKIAENKVGENKRDDKSLLRSFGRATLSFFGDETLKEFRDEVKFDIMTIGPDTPKEDIGDMHSLLADIEGEMARRV